MNKKFIVLSLLLSSVILLARCVKDDIVPTTALTSANIAVAVLSPADNPQTSQKINLGRMLFWDPILSGGKDVSCASCHHPSMGYTDNLDIAIGTNGTGLGTLRHFASPNDIQFTKRNTPTILNTGLNGMDANGNYDPATAAMFYDLRVSSLETQSLQPIQTLEEMMGHQFTSATAIDSVVSRLKATPDYVTLFNDAFGSNAISGANISKAIASFERTLTANNSPYDKYQAGDKTAMTTQQVQGLTDFQTDGCSRCHNGPMFSDYQIHVLSVPDNSKIPTDAGVNGTYGFRTPSLRNLSLTAPYMHSGVFTTIDQVIDFYDRVGGNRSQNNHVSNNQLDANLRRVNNNTKASIIAFLKALDDPNFDKTIPASVPSKLKVGGNI
jgi:cytochrome c peroxidase